MKQRRTIVVSFIFLIISTVQLNSTVFDFSSSLFQEGSLIVGYFERPLSERLGLGVNVYEQTQYSDSLVPGAELSTQFNEFQRKETEIFLPFYLSAGLLFDSITLSLNYISITETNKATFVLVDEIGEFGTDYLNQRTTRFISPRIGFTASVGGGRADLRYSAQVSPFYYFILNQQVSYTYSDHEDSLEDLQLDNRMSSFAAPYISQNIRIRAGRFIRLTADHSYQYLPYRNIQLDNTGLDVMIADDPVHLHGIRLVADIGIPIQNILTINLGIGQRMNIQLRNHLPPENRIHVTREPYFSLGFALE
ncbi:hypothetical protein [Spirochaeta dissipatitropha]